MAEQAAVRVPTLDGIPEPLHAHFAPVKDGDADLFEFRPPVIPDKETAGLKSALEKAKRKAAAADQFEQDLKAYRERWTVDGQELDPDEIRTIVEERNAQKGKEMISVAEFEAKFKDRKEKAVAAAVKDYEHKLAAKDQDIADRDAQLHELLIVGGIRAAAQDPALPYRLRPGAAELLIKIAQADKSIRVIGGKAVPMDGDQPAPDSTIAEWFQQQVTKYGLAEESQGVGATPSANGTAPRGLRRSQMSPKEKSDYTMKYGSDKYLSLPM